MGHRKKSVAPRSKQAANLSANNPVESHDGSSSSFASVKEECERALTTLQRGTHTKALRLIKESCTRQKNSVHAALIHRVQATIHGKLASIIHEPNAKQRHLKNAAESARKAVELSPNSIEFAHFYANLLYELANDGKEYEEVVQECERALAVENPVDPAKESLQEENEQNLSTAEARILHVQSELRSLIQESSWMKNLGNAEEKYRLIVPVSRVMEDPMEERRPNEIKKATKTPEERRKEIEVKVEAARLLQQQKSEAASTSPEVKEKNRQRDRRRMLCVSDSVRAFWNLMSLDSKKDFLRIRVSDLEAYFDLWKDATATDSEVLSKALAFAEANKTWKFWVCFRCKQFFLDFESHMQHVLQQHMRNLIPKMQTVLPQSVDNEWTEMLLNCSWDPLDVSAAVKMIVKEYDGDQGSVAYPLVDKWPTVDEADRASLLERIRDTFELLVRHNYLAAGLLNKVIQFATDELQSMVSGSHLLNYSVDQGPTCIRFLGATQLRKILELLQDISHSCDLAKDSENTAPIDDVNGATQVLEIKEKIILSADASCLLLDEHLLPDAAIEDATRGNANGSNGIRVVQDADALLSWIFDFTFSPAEDKTQQGLEILQMLEKEFCHLQSLCEKKCDHISYEEELQAVEDLCLEEGKKRETSIEIVRRSYESVLTKRKEELLENESDDSSYEDALQAVEDLCLEESKKRETSIEFVRRSYESVLTKRKELLENESDGGTFDLECKKRETSSISDVLKEVEALNVTSQLCDLESCEYDVRGAKDYLHQVDTWIEVGICRQKEQLSVEVSKIDALIMRNVTGTQQLEVKLETVSEHDYRSTLLPLMKSYLRVCLEDMAEKDAIEKSDAAGEALLAELERDSKKGIRGGNGSRHSQDKNKNKKKNKKFRKSRDSKATGGNELHILTDETAEQISLPVVYDGDNLDSEVVSTNSDDLKQQEDKLRLKIELEAWERMLEENLEYQRRIENEAKLKQVRFDDGVLMDIVRSISGEGDTKTSRQLQAQEDDEERFQAEKVVRQSLDAYQAQSAPLHVNDHGVSPNDVSNEVLNETVVHTGLQNEVGEYNCFLNVIIQSLWHLRRFRDELLRRSTSDHVHVGDPCVVCALHGIFFALNIASTDSRKEPVAPTSLRTALSNLYPDSNYFQKGQMNDASEVLAALFDCLHRSFTPASSVCDADSVESNPMGSWDCASNACIVHSLFGMDIFERMNCNSCGLVSRHLKYTTLFHNINASALRRMKVMCAESSFDELLNLVEMSHQLACDPGAGGCGKLNYIHHVLSNSPHVFVTVLGWQKTCENADDIAATLAALNTEIHIRVLYRGLDPKNNHNLVSVVCYRGQHYHCFAYNHDREEWIMYDDKTVKITGSWADVITMCERGHLQPQVLFFEYNR